MSNVLTDVRHFVPRFQLDMGQHYEVIAVEIVSRKDYSVNVLNREACAYYVLLFYSICNQMPEDNISKHYVP